MSELWLEKYTSEKMYVIDPFIPHLMATNTPFILDTHKTVQGQPLNAMLREAGYSFLYGLPFNGIRSGERQIITYCSNLPYATLKKDDHLARIRMLAVILITQFSVAEQRDPETIKHFDRPQLTPRENQALSWLARGLRNDRIAQSMAISEVTVRKHLRSARTKLGANTREQALSIALHRGLIRFQG